MSVSRFSLSCPTFRGVEAPELTQVLDLYGSACWARTSDKLINSLVFKARFSTEIQSLTEYPPGHASGQKAHIMWVFACSVSRLFFARAVGVTSHSNLVPQRGTRWQGGTGGTPVAICEDEPAQHGCYLPGWNPGPCPTPTGGTQPDAEEKL